jgi:hypothetical protein
MVDCGCLSSPRITTIMRTFVRLNITKAMQHFFGLVFLLCLCATANAATGVFPTSTFNNLDYGLYCFGDV